MKFSSLLKKLNLSLITLCCLELICFTRLSSGPCIKEQNKIKHLIVNNQVFTVLSIEDHKTVDFSGNVRENYFREAKQLYANTISVTFRWNFFEKEMGRYDTTILRNIKMIAEKYNLKVIILWFGSNISGHENCVPNYIRNDSIMYIPYTRSDKSFATKISDMGGDRIYCYSLDEKHPNDLLLRERKALQALMTWIKINDSEETFIMMQLGGELFVHPELWRPWPPVYLSSARLFDGQNVYRWDTIFPVRACSLKIESHIKMTKNQQLEFCLISPTGRKYWSTTIKSNGKLDIHIGGKFINQRCQLMIQRKESNFDTIEVSKIMIKPIAERCHCQRCNEIFFTHRFDSDKHFQQSVFVNYIKALASAVAEVDQSFPLFLNILVSHDAKTLLGNPYYRPKDYLHLVPDIDFLGPDIYYESKVSVIDSFYQGQNTIFIPEAGKFKYLKDSDYLNAFSLIFPILSAYRGIGIQIYDLQSSKFGLLSTKWQWEENAYLVRNSFCAIRQLPLEIFNKKSKIIGFRNITKEIFFLEDIKIEIESISASEYARGIISKMGDSLILCGIGFKAAIDRSHFSAGNIKIERGYWEDNKYISLGALNPTTYKIGETIEIEMDADDFSSPDTFDPLNKQYCVLLTPF